MQGQGESSPQPKTIRRKFQYPANKLKRWALFPKKLQSGCDVSGVWSSLHAYVIREHWTVELLNNEHVGMSHFVHYREVVFYLEIKNYFWRLKHVHYSVSFIQSVLYCLSCLLQVCYIPIRTHTAALMKHMAICIYYSSLYSIPFCWNCCWNEPGDAWTLAPALPRPHCCQGWAGRDGESHWRWPWLWSRRRRGGYEKQQLILEPGEKKKGDKVEKFAIQLPIIYAHGNDFWWW